VLEGAVVVGALAVLASPLSWSHHQTALVLAAGCAVSSRRVLTTAWSAVVYVIMVLPWPFLLPPGSPGRWLLGELPLLVALVVIGSAAGCALRASRRRRPPTPMSTAQATEMTRGAES
jgi:alpha-1,2-mannosyltransferase